MATHPTILLCKLLARSAETILNLALTLKLKTKLTLECETNPNTRAN